MSFLDKPYYPLHQIETGLYATPGLFQLADGTPYEGPYHILPNGIPFTQFRPQDNSVRLYQVVSQVSPDVIQYNKLTESTIYQPRSPQPYNLIPTVQDYSRGYVNRYLCQKRNDPLNTIIEIGADQADMFSNGYDSTINYSVWNYVQVKWIISLMPRQDAYKANEREVLKASTTFKGIQSYLSDLLQFYR